MPYRRIDNLAEIQAWINSRCPIQWRLGTYDRATKILVLSGLPSPSEILQPELCFLLLHCPRYVQFPGNFVATTFAVGNEALQHVEHPLSRRFAGLGLDCVMIRNEMSACYVFCESLALYAQEEV
jgi:hypothetical protein